MLYQTFLFLTRYAANSPKHKHSNRKLRVVGITPQVFGDYSMKKTQVALAALALVASTAAFAADVGCHGCIARGRNVEVIRLAVLRTAGAAKAHCRGQKARTPLV